MRGCVPNLLDQNTSDFEEQSQCTSPPKEIQSQCTGRQLHQLGTKHASQRWRVTIQHQGTVSPSSSFLKTFSFLSYSMESHFTDSSRVRPHLQAIRQSSGALAGTSPSNIFQGQGGLREVVRCELLQSQLWGCWLLCSARGLDLWTWATINPARLGRWRLTGKAYINFKISVVAAIYCILIMCQA